MAIVLDGYATSRDRGGDPGAEWCEWRDDSQSGKEGQEGFVGGLGRDAQGTEAMDGA